MTTHSEPEKENAINISSIPFEKIPAYLGAASAVLYIMGFLVATSHFASRGIYDPLLLSPRYVISGALMAFTFAAYYFFVWRKVALHLETVIINPGSSPVTGMLLHIYFLVEYLVACAVASAWIGGILIVNLAVGPIQIILISIYFIDQLMLKIGIYKTHRTAAFMTSFSLNIFGALVFFMYCQVSPALLSLWGILSTLTTVGLLVVGDRGWRLGEDKPYGFFYIGVMVVVGIVTFGANVYGHISARYGGAQPPKIEISLASKADDNVRALLDSAKDVYLILDSDSSLTVQLGKSTDSAKFLRIGKDAVSAVLFLNPPPEKKPLPEALERFRPLFEAVQTK